MYEVKLRNYREGLKHVSSIDDFCLKVVPVIGDLVNVTPLTSGRMISTFHIAETHLFESSHLHIFNKSLSDFAVEKLHAHIIAMAIKYNLVPLQCILALSNFPFVIQSAVWHLHGVKQSNGGKLLHIYVDGPA